MCNAIWTSVDGESLIDMTAVECCGCGGRYELGSGGHQCPSAPAPEEEPSED